VHPTNKGQTQMPNGNEFAVYAQNFNTADPGNSSSSKGDVDDPRLNLHHHKQFKDRGFNDVEIELMKSQGLRSVTAEELADMGYLTKKDGMPYLDCGGWVVTSASGFTQLRPDYTEKSSKYLNPTNYKSVIEMPKGAQWVTEGFVDAAFCQFRGEIQMGTCAGVSHYKALTAGSKTNWLFDADGWFNPQVFTNLVNAAIHTGGRVQLFPVVTENGKDGAQEYFNSGKSKEDFKALLEGARMPKDFLFELPLHWGGITSEPRKIELVTALIKLSFDLLNQHEQELLLNIAAKALKLKLPLVKRIAETEFRESKAGITKKAELDLKKKERQKAQMNPHQGNGCPYRLTKGGDPTPAPESEVANHLKDAYREVLAWNSEAACFYRYEAEAPGLWSRADDDLIYKEIVLAALDSSPVCNDYSHRYSTGIFKLLRLGLATNSWKELPGLVPMLNGVFEIATGELLPHAPGHRLRWQLPYEYEAGATCEPIIAWLRSTQDGDERRVQLLRAWLKAVLTRKSDLQRFLELTGPGGSGKSTYLTLATALVGSQNVLTTTLKILEESKFETASVYGKRLILINDPDSYGGGISILKSITGQDSLRFEEKNKQSKPGFVSNAIVMTANNGSIQTKDYTSGIERRRCSVPFLKQVKASDRIKLIEVSGSGYVGEFAKMLPGLFNWVMLMPDDDVTYFVKNTHEAVPSLNHWKNDVLSMTNPMVGWLDDCCLFEDHKTYVGVATKERVTDGTNKEGKLDTRSWDRYKNSDSWLYANYVQHSAKVGTKPLSLRKFSETLIDICSNQLGQSGISKSRDEQGAFIQGVTLRGKDCEEPNSITGATEIISPILPTPEPEESTSVPPIEAKSVPSEEVQASRVDAWITMFKQASYRGDGALSDLYQKMWQTFPGNNNPSKQAIWNGLNENCQSRIKKLPQLTANTA